LSIFSLAYPSGEINVEKKPDSGGLLQAVRELRLSLGDTQQSFAHRLGLAISTVVRYELTRAPKGQALALLARLAESQGRHDLGKPFIEALEKELGGSNPLIPCYEEHALSQTFIDVYRNHPQLILATVVSLLVAEAIKDDPIRHNQLEVLLVLLRKANGPVMAKVKARIKEIMATKGISEAQASQEVMLSEPALYLELLKENQGAAKGTIFENTMDIGPRRKGARK
jgi:transcriptional regulator with XRE-family HTH domain